MASAGYPRPARGLPQTPSLPISPPKGIAPSRATLPRPAFLFLRQTKSQPKQNRPQKTFPRACFILLYQENCKNLFDIRGGHGAS